MFWVLHLLRPAEPGGSEPASLWRHVGPGHGGQDVLRAGQSHGFSHQLQSLHLLPQTGPGPCGLPQLQGHASCH